MQADITSQNSHYGDNVILVDNTNDFLRQPQIDASVIASPNEPFLNSDSGAYTKTKGYHRYL